MMLTVEGQKRLIEDEGKRYVVYDDATGQAVKTLPSGGIPTIGIGRNLASRGLSDGEIEYLFNNDVEYFWYSIQKLMPWLADFAGKFPVRNDVVLMVEFNTGDVMQFRKMLTALQANDWETAASELLDSAAARENTARYQRMAQAIINGYWVEPAPQETIEVSGPGKTKGG